MHQLNTTLFLVVFATLTVIGASKNANLDSTPVVVSEKESATGRIFPVIERDVQVGTEITKDRAFFGAPPPSPHKDDGSLDHGCLYCHAKENRLEKKHRAIEPVPHAEYSQCMQCHVDGSKRDYGPFEDRKTPFVETLFLGLDYPGRGSRANDYSPPTVPHKTYMRDDCQACHGPSGEHIIRTPHPERTQCLQCHMPEQAMDYTRTID